MEEETICQRKYISKDFDPSNWSEVEFQLKKLISRKINSAKDLEEVIEYYSELSDIISEVSAWKEIKMTQFADNEKYSKEQADFYENIIAPSEKYFFDLDKKIYENPFFKMLPEERYSHLGKILENGIEMFCEENIPIFVEENKLSSKFAELYSSITVDFKGKERTLEAMDIFLLDSDRKVREEAWRLSAERMSKEREKFEDLFDNLKNLRVKIAKNAGFKNYRDYVHKSYGRFDYTPEDLYEFHDSVEKVVVPVMKEINEARKNKLQVDKLRPWDMKVSLDGKRLEPFKKTEELLEKSIEILDEIDPDFSRILNSMKKRGFLDLDNRKGKAPGGYSCSLEETKSDFIFMNAVGSQRDVQTLLHESGHAVHSVLRNNEPIAQYKNPPTEVCELASMSMELISMDFWDKFYDNEDDFKNAKREQLEDVVSVFSGVVIGDSFQHWIYLNPNHTQEERDEKFAEIKEKFGSGVDWSSLEKERKIGWLGILHFFEVPFYYIEYAISQLGAIAIWKNYKENPKSAIESYKNFMKLGYSKPLPEIYNAAGIKFDFSKEYLEEMIDFVFSEIKEVE